MSPDEATFVAHALSLAALYGPGPWPGDGYPLPDEKPREHGRFVLPSVVLDGINTHHRRAAAQPVTELADGVVAGMDDPARLLELFAGLSPVRIADDLVRELRSRDLPREKLRRAARFVTENATRREVAKLGIVLLGICGDERDRELLQLLGTLDEFALFAVVALLRTQTDGQRAVFELARQLVGWGRIHAVERLAGCSDPDIRAWLLRSGFRNDVMDEYLAYIAATTGGLYEALLDDTVDDELLDGAAGILRALAFGGPAEDMRDYPDAVAAMHRFAELVDRADPAIVRLDAALTIEKWLSNADFDWPDGEPGRLRVRYAALLFSGYRIPRRRWRELVTGVLSGNSAVTGEGHIFETALSCAGRLGIDALPDAIARLRIEPDNAYVWQWAMRHAGADRIGGVVELAEQLLPLAELAHGPSESLGIGREFAADRVLEIVVGRLRVHPGIGAGLLPVALANRVIRCRRAALATLAAWPPAVRPAASGEWVAAAAEWEIDPELRREMLAFLAG